LYLSFLDESELTGATNLMAHYGLEHAYNKSNGRKIKDTLSSFLPHLPGNIDSPASMDGRYLQFQFKNSILFLCSVLALRIPEEQRHFEECVLTID